MPISRRDFLMRTSGFVTVSAMVPRWAVDGTRFFEESVGAELANRTLVVLELAGGNDDLNTVVPYTDNLYTQMRSRIGIPAASVLPLDNRLGLNPVMTGLKSLWDHNRVAIVENVGYPNSSLSHFAARDVWHTADPQLAQRNGWLGRWADRYVAGTGNPLTCTAISQSLPRTLLADNVGVPSFVNLASYQYTTDGSYPGDRNNQIRTFLTQNGAEYEIANSLDELSQVGEDAIASSNVLQTVGTGYVAGATYPAGTLGAGLLLIAQIINANVGARILYITFGGFDNHATENVDHDPLLTTVSAGIQAFFADLDAHGKSHARHGRVLRTFRQVGLPSRDRLEPPASLSVVRVEVFDLDRSLTREAIPAGLQLRKDGVVEVVIDPLLRGDGRFLSGVVAGLLRLARQG